MAWTLRFWLSNPTPPALAVTWNYGTGIMPSDVPASQATNITNHINSMASISTLAQGRLNSYGQDIRIGYRSGDFGTSQRSSAIDDYILIDLNASSTVYFFNTLGQLVQGDIKLTIMHELAHIYLNADDPAHNASEAIMNGTDFDFRGPVIDEQNAIAEDAGLTSQIQTSYYATVLSTEPLFGAFSPNVSYSNGNSVETSRIGTQSVDNIDHSTNTNTLRLRDLIFGLDGNDTIKSGKGSDFLYGGDDEDSLTGGDGADQLYGEDDDDELMGEAEDDILAGGAGDDTLDGGFGGDEIWGGNRDEYLGAADGIDLVDYSASASALKISLTEEPSGLTIYVDSEGGAIDSLYSIEKILGTPGRDLVYVNGDIPAGTLLTIDAAGGQAGAPDVLNLGGAGSGVTVELDANGAGTLTTEAAGSGVVQLRGFHTQFIASHHDDNISDGSEEAKSIDGGWGDDTVSVSSGNALIAGGYGDDSLSGGDGNDILVGGIGEVGGVGTDTLDGGAGADLLIGGQEGEYLAYTTAMELNGGDGHDYLLALRYYGGSVLDGGAGNDVLDVNDASSPSVIKFYEDSGHDVILGSGGIEIDMTSLSKSDMEVIWNAEFMEVHPPSEGPGYVEIMGDLVFRVKSTGASIYISDIHGRSYWQNSPSEALTPPHLLLYMESLPLITFSDGPLDYDFWGGTDFDGASAPIALHFGSVSAYDSALQDHAAATAADSADTQGTSSSDNLAGGPGDDSVAAGAGDDYISSSGGNDAIDGGDGADTLNIFGGAAGFNYIWSAEGDFVVSDRGMLEGNQTLVSVEQVYFTTDNVTYAIGELAGDMGTAANDPSIEGTIRNDGMHGLAGHDSLSGLNGHDTLQGDAENDTLSGGAGGDSLDGGDGVDWANYSGGPRVTADLQIPIDNFGEAAGDSYNSIENLRGGVFADNLRGDASANRIEGGGRNDVIVGRAGDDTLVGGPGFDQLAGQQGRDSFLLASADPVDYDLIVDLALNETILLDAAAFGLAPGALDPDAFVLGSGAQDAEDRIIYLESVGKIFFDPDGAGGVSRSLIAIIENRPAMGASDFMVI